MLKNYRCKQVTSAFQDSSAFQDASISQMSPTFDPNEVLAELSKLCRIPSIAFAGFDPAILDDSAQATALLLTKWGFPDVRVVRNENRLVGQGGSPAVIAAWGNDPHKPTILLYAHHDVQPGMRVEKWQSPVFEPTIRNNRLFARGAADDKAGIVIHAASARMIFQEFESAPVNLRVLIEGEEEVGSPGLASLLSAHKQFLQCDAVIVADLGNFAPGVPAITASLRGMVALEVEVRSLEHSLHSGMWSGPIPDPVQALCKMIASLTDLQGRIIVPGILDSVQSPPEALRQAYEQLPFSESVFRKEAGLKSSSQILVNASEIPLSLWMRPSITVTTLEAGNRRNAGNVLLDSAWARISVRLAPGMHWEKTLNQLEQHFQQHCPWGLELHLHREEGANAWITSVEHPWFQRMLNALNKGYSQAAQVIGCGASIPGAPLFSDTFGDIPILMTGVEDALSNAHGENESVSIPDLMKAIQSQYLFFKSFMQEHTQPIPSTETQMSEEELS